MSSGVQRRIRGSFIGTGANIDIKTIGFRPKSVRLWNVTDPTEGYWQEGMADASVFKRVAAGTATVPTTLGVTPLADGFRLGADTDLNVAAQVVHYEAAE